MRFFIVVNALVFIAVSYFVNTLALQLSIPILILLGAYTFFKRFSSMAHLVLGMSLGLAPIAGVVAVQGEITGWSLMLAVGVMFWVAGFDLLYSLQDIAFDRANKLHSIPSKFGPQYTMWIARFFHLMAVIFWILFVLQAGLGMWASVALFVSAIMLGYEHYLVNKDFTKIDKAFFTVNGYLGFIFLFFIILEVM
jgi:4-hydroxybenzoate polyprenyltransferase